jgi:hypothetical protein
MSPQSVEKRLSALELRVAQLQAEVNQEKPPRKDWRRTIGAFTDDAGMQEILKEAMRLRERDRSKLRARKRTKRKPRS